MMPPIYYETQNKIYEEAQNQTKAKQQKVEGNALKYKQAYKQAVRNANTGLTPAQLEDFVNSTIKKNADAIIGQFSKVKTPEEFTDKIRNYTTLNESIIKADVKTYLQANRDASLLGTERNLSEVTQEGKAAKPIQPLVLRSRFVLPDENTVSETWQQTLLDVTAADMFSWRDSNEETGTYNSVYLYGKANEEMLTRDAGVPRPPDNLEELVGTGPIIPQWRDEQDMDEYMIDKAKVMVSEALVRNLPPGTSLGIQDANEAPNQVGFMTDILSLKPGFQKDYTQGLSGSELDRVGLRPITDTWLDPLAPARNTYYPPRPAEDSYRIMAEGVGHDYLF